MHSSRRKLGILCVALFAISALALALASSGPPLVNWAAPATYTPSGKHLLAGEIGTGPTPFYPITPCRQYDTRSSGGAITSGVDRTITLTGAPCGIPAGTRAISVNITVFNISGAGGNGVLQVGIAAAPTTAWINYPATETQRANAGAVPTNASGQIVVNPAQGGGTVDLVVDVNGYYLAGATSMPASQQFAILGNYSANPAILGTNTNTGGFSTGVMGLETSTTGNGIGVQGIQNGSGWGVYGTTPSGLGVYGLTTSGTGVYGFSSTGTGAQAYTTGVVNGNSGLIAANLGTGSAYTFGIKGTTASTGLDSAGIKGIGGFGDPLGDTTDCGPCFSSGVRGVNDNPPASGTAFGVLGISRTRGVGGVALAATGTSSTAYGYLGYFDGTNYFGVFAVGNYGGTGAKYFVEPHPTDATKVIRYISMEGPEAGTYFRGSSRVQHGRAVIEVPETFRMVTAEDGLTVQLTAVGAAASMYIESQDLNTIVVRSNKDVAFHYQVNGVRHGYQNFDPIATSTIYMPDKADAKMPAHFTEAQKASLVSNGTYMADGTVNMETARALHWDTIWDQALKQAPPAKALPAPGQDQ